MVSYKIVEDDSRGIFAELIKFKQGQISYFEINPHNFRGGHYHKKKTEIFILLKGKCTLLLENNKKETLSIDMKKFARYVVPINTKHKLVNSCEFIVQILLYCDEIYDPNNEDTYFD